MIPGVAAGYATAARGTQQVGFTADLVPWNLTGGDVISGLPVSGGSLRVGAEGVRRKGSITVATSGALVPASSSDSTHPYQHHHVRLSARVIAEAGDFTIPLAMLRCSELSADVTPSGSTLTFTLADDAEEALAGRIWPGVAWVQDRPAESLEARVQATLAAMYAPALFTAPSTATGVTVPAGQIVLGPKVKTYPELVTLCEGYGYFLGVNHLGRYVLTRRADAGTFAFGGTGARTATVVGQKWSMKDLVNASAFLVNSAANGTVQGLAYDSSDPLIAPTTSGRWGQRWTTEDSRDADPSTADAAAARQLVGTAGGSRRITFKAVPDYRMEGLDQVSLNLVDQKAVGTFIVESVDFDLSPGALMTVTCQEVRGA